MLLGQSLGIFNSCAFLAISWSLKGLVKWCYKLNNSLWFLYLHYNYIWTNVMFWNQNQIKIFLYMHQTSINVTLYFDTCRWLNYHQEDMFLSMRVTPQRHTVRIQLLQLVPFWLVVFIRTTNLLGKARQGKMRSQLWMLIPRKHNE